MPKKTPTCKELSITPWVLHQTTKNGWIRTRIISSFTLNRLNLVTICFRGIGILGPESIWEFCYCDTCSFLPLTSMAKGRKFSPNVQWIAVQLSALLSKDNISIYTGISLRMVKQILAHFEETGTIPDEEKEWQRRSQVLCDEDVNVRHNLLLRVWMCLTIWLVFICDYLRDTRFVSGWTLKSPCSELWHMCFKVDNLAAVEGWRTYNEESLYHVLISTFAIELYWHSGHIWQLSARMRSGSNM